MFNILLKKSATMFLLMLCGYTIKKKKVISGTASSDLANVLLYVATPAIIINPFINSQENFGKILVETTFISLICILVCAIVSALIYRNDQIAKYATTFTNCGYMGIPIVTSILGTAGVKYLSMYIVLANIFNWTLGVKIMSTNKNDLSLKKVFFNPSIIAFVVGILLFTLRIKVPSLVIETFSSLSELNASLSMIILGIYLADSDIKQVFINKKSYQISFVRLVLIPAVCIPIILLVPFGSFETKLVATIAVSTPCATSTGIFSQKFGRDYKTASYYVCLSTVLSLITLPTVTAIIGLLLNK